MSYGVYGFRTTEHQGLIVPTLSYHSRIEVILHERPCNRHLSGPEVNHKIVTTPFAQHLSNVRISPDDPGEHSLTQSGPYRRLAAATTG